MTGRGAGPWSAPVAGGHVLREQRREALAERPRGAGDVDLHRARRDVEPVRDVGGRQLVAKAKRSHLALAWRHRREDALDGAGDVVRFGVSLALRGEGRLDADHASRELCEAVMRHLETEAAKVGKEKVADPE